MYDMMHVTQNIKTMKQTTMDMAPFVYVLTKVLWCDSLHNQIYMYLTYNLRLSTKKTSDEIK